MNKSKKINNILLYIGLFIICILTLVLCKFMLTEKISMNEKFLLVECKSSAHDDERVYMKVNNIEESKEEDSFYLLSFDLIYEGDKPIQVTNGDSNFSDLSRLELIVKTKNTLKKLDYEYFEIGDTSTYDIRVHSYRENIPKTLNPGDSIKDLKIGIEFNDYPDGKLSGLKFIIKSEPLEHNKGGRSKYRKMKKEKVKELYVQIYNENLRI